MRELEEEVEALQAGRAHRAKLMALMEKKALVGDLFNHLRLARAPESLLCSCSVTARDIIALPSLAVRPEITQVLQMSHLAERMHM